ncbi:MAG TPA: helix-turn-helix transcriptional regulator [Candidatus Polarisedimenticolaceae bacterium]
MPSFGETLRRERELRQISLREISEATKINLRYLDALERDDFRHLPGGVFNKGFVRAYAQYIGIDADGMVDAYLDEERRQTQSVEPPRPGEPLRRGGPALAAEREAERAAADRRGRRRVLLGAAILALLLVAVGAAAVALGWIDLPLPKAWR